MPDQEPVIEGDGSKPNPTPTAPQAQAEPPLTMSAIKELLGSFKTEIVTEAKNGINADLRRAGVFKKEKNEEPPPTPAAAAAPASSGLSLADVQGMLKRERVVTTRSTKHELNPAQVKWLETALSGVEADRLDEVADSFVNDLGLVKAPPTATQPVTTTTPPAIPTQTPISDKGSPAPGQYVANWKLELGQNPIGMSAAARTAMDAELGAEKARKMRLEAGNAQAERIKVTRPQG